MNLNSYLALMGGCFKEVKGLDGRLNLLRAERGEGFDIPDADYIITLDADSMLFSDYASRLVPLLERPENARVAIAQTPYSAFPHAPGALERIAGATTDVQHLLHQGFTKYEGTYWVGANALIRKKAIEDIAVEAIENGVAVTKFIQDRTVIEDTESTVDLIAREWQLYNYPARLAYSATPPDFGALLIQRRRWANGGLIILPKFLSYLRRQPCCVRVVLQGFVQIHYLTSLAFTSFGVLALLLYPFEQGLRSIWLPLTALPYFYCYARDLGRSGYSRASIFQVYALNLALLPVHLGGVLKSLRQSITGNKSAFVRTPKVGRRTSVPSIYLLAIVGFLIYCVGSAVLDTTEGRWAHALFAVTNAGFMSYAIIWFLKPRAIVQDLSRSLRRLRRPHSSN
jgi:hypothetical protein